MLSLEAEVSACFLTSSDCLAAMSTSTPATSNASSATSAACALCSASPRLEEGKEQSGDHRGFRHCKAEAQRCKRSE